MVLKLDRTQLKKNAPIAKEIYYPDSDGKPMAESDLHRDLMVYLIHLLQRFFQDTKAYISGNLLIYYEEGNPRKSVAPDCFVVLGVEQYRRRTYRIWDEGKGPDIVFEVSSNSTKRDDTGKKKALYAQLGVKEYFVYDPTGDYLKRYLKGYVLQPGVGYVPMTALNQSQLEKSTADKVVNAARPITPEYISHVLGLRFVIDEHNQLIAYDVQSGKRLLSDAEERMEAELDAQMAKEKAAVAEDKAAVAEDKATAAEDEAAVAKALYAQAQAEIEALKAQIGQSKSGN